MSNTTSVEPTTENQYQQMAGSQLDFMNQSLLMLPASHPFRKSSSAPIANRISRSPDRDASATIVAVNFIFGMQLTVDLAFEDGSAIRFVGTLGGFCPPIPGVLAGGGSFNVSRDELVAMQYADVQVSQLGAVIQIHFWKDNSPVGDVVGGGLGSFGWAGGRGNWVAI